LLGIAINDINKSSCIFVLYYMWRKKCWL
jgi:hypothetical protein